MSFVALLIIASTALADPDDERSGVAGTRLITQHGEFRSDEEEKEETPRPDRRRTREPRRVVLEDRVQEERRVDEGQDEEGTRVEVRQEIQENRQSIRQARREARQEARQLVRELRRQADQVQRNTRLDIREIRSELREDIAQVRAEDDLDAREKFREIRQLRQQARADIRQMRQESRQEIALLRSEMRDELADIRGQRRGEVVEARRDIRDVRAPLARGPIRQGVRRLAERTRERAQAEDVTVVERAQRIISLAERISRLATFLSPPEQARVEVEIDKGVEVEIDETTPDRAPADAVPADTTIEVPAVGPPVTPPVDPQGAAEPGE